MNQKPLVIAIAAVSGGGKTVITNQLVDRLNNAKAMYFDNYEFDEYPDDICKWVNDGADYNKWNITPLIKDIQILLNQSLHFIVLDYPFAYLHSGMREYIDLAVFIDTPLDIAMARRILRDFSDAPIDGVLDDLTNYLSNGRTAYLEMQTVKANSDIVIDGSLPLEIIVDRIMEAVGKQV